MESTEPYTAADESPEELAKKSQEPDSMEKPTHIRFLVSKALAGSLIGKGGSTITEFQENSGAQIALSRNGEYFPGTTCRIVVVSGTTKQVLTALQLVLAKFHTELQAEDGSGIELRRTRILVPYSSCGGIIGKGGATIRSFIEDSKAAIKISPIDFTFGLSDRLVTLSGTMEERMRAISLILTKLTEDDDYSQQVHSPNSYAGRYHAGFPGRDSVELASSHLGSEENHKEDNFNSVTIAVSDEHIGRVLGRGGRFITLLSQLTDTRIKISGRGNLFPGTTDRKVFISGLQSSIDVAVSFIEAQLRWASERAKDKTDIEEES